MTYWLVGRAISINSLRDGRADYGKQILGTLSQELSTRFGAGFDQSNLSRMVQFARLFPDHAAVVELASSISWSHRYTLLAIKSEEARAFYTAEAAAKRLSVRELKKAISRKAYERERSPIHRSPRDPLYRETPSATR